jgi:hypothetical protein
MRSSRHRALLAKVLRRIYATAIAKVDRRELQPTTEKELAELVSRVIGDKLLERHLGELCAIVGEAENEAISRVHVAMHATISGDHDAIDDAVMIAMSRGDE